jgi:hypothetical protein
MAFRGTGRADAGKNIRLPCFRGKEELTQIFLGAKFGENLDYRPLYQNGGTASTLVVEIKHFILRPLAVLSSESFDELLGVRDPPEE